MDLSQLSNAQLEQIAGGGARDFSTMSDAELAQIVDADEREREVTSTMDSLRQTYGATGLPNLAKKWFTLGLKDEADAAAAGLVSGLSGKGFKRGYEVEKEAMRRLEEETYAQNPIAAPVVSVGASLATAPVAAGAKAIQAGTRGIAAWEAAKQAAKAGAVTGGIAGAAEGEGLEGRLGSGVAGLALGGGLGGALGAAGGAVGFRGAPAAPSPTVAAAERLGVDLPRAIATDSMALQRAAQSARNVPGAGDPIIRAIDDSVEQLGTKAGEVADSFGGSGAEAAGDIATRSITGWVKGKSAEMAEKLYERVDRYIDPNVLSPLNKTQEVAAGILAKRAEAGLEPTGSAVDMLTTAMTRPGGLTFNGMKTLRTGVGELLDNNLLPANISKGELKKMYGALSEDLRAAAKNAGGQSGLAAFDFANKGYAKISERREALARIVGKKGDVPAAQVFDRLVAAAGEKSRANVSLLQNARRAMGDEWDEVASAVVGRLGRDVEGNFSPQRFITDYGKLSEGGKSILFRSTGRADLAAALDDIAAVSRRFKETQRFANPSGTASNVAGMTTGFGFMTSPIMTLSTIIGGNTFARVMASPASAKSVAQWSKAYEVAVRRPTVGTLKSLQGASQRLSGQVASEFGVKIDPMKALPTGARPSYADNDEEK